MARAVTSRTTRRSTPADVETDLAALWRDVALTGPVSRAMMSNLIVFGRRAGALNLNEVAARHPSRVITIAHRGEDATECDPIAATVAVVTFGPPRARYGIEQIAIESTCSDEALPSAIRRFVRGDLPTSVWWAEDLSRVSPMESIVAMGRQFVFDSRGWADPRAAIRALAPFLGRGVDLVDLNWQRLTPLRHALLLASADCEGSAWRPGDVRITHRPGERMLGWLLAGWLASRLEWPNAGALSPVEQEGDEMLTIDIGGSMAGGLDGHRGAAACGGGSPFVIGARRQGEADVVAAELHTLAHDACLHDALSALARRLSAA